MMHYVYVLQSEKDESIYIGNTRDIDRRLTEHNRGNVHHTKKHAPYKLVYYEAYADKKDAIERESKLKHHGSAIGHLKRRLGKSLNKRIQPKGRG